MPPSTSVVEFLAARRRRELPGVCVIFGDDAFFKRLALDEIHRCSDGEQDPEFAESRFRGDDAQWRDVHDALSTASLFDATARRLVFVESADGFVSRNRSVLEDYAEGSQARGVLILDVKTWPKNTRLYKRLAKRGLQIDCGIPKEPALISWITYRAEGTHQAPIDSAAAELLIDIVGPLPGVLDQELLKLATCVEPGERITLEAVRSTAGGGRLQTAWQMLDAALDGQSAAALGQLDRLVLAGEHPVALLAQIAATLRRFAAACRVIEDAEAAGRRTSLKVALEAAGVRAFVLSKTERQLRRLGRARAAQLFRRLLEADRALKGHSELDSRIVLEELLVWLAEPAAKPPARHPRKAS